MVSGPAGIGRTRLAAELAGEVHRQRALVLYGMGALARARDARRPTLLVLDDVDGAAAIAWPKPFAARVEPAGRCHRCDADAIERLSGAEHSRSGRSARTRSARSQRSMRPATRRSPSQTWPSAAAACRSARTGSPPTGHAYEAARRLRPAADRTAIERSDLRHAEIELAATSSSCRPCASAPSYRRPTTPPACARTRAWPRSTSMTPSTSSGASGWSATWSPGSPARRCSASSGPSGSGKSSAMRAGLLPALAGGVLPGSEEWAPGAAAPRRASAARRCAARGAARRPLRARRVDQFEEIFTRCRDEDERAASSTPRRAAPPPVTRRSSPFAPTSTATARHTRELARAARRQPRPRRGDAARRAAAGDRAARPSAQGCTSSPSWSTACSPTSSVSPARCRCCPPRWSSSGSGARAGAASGGIRADRRRARRGRATGGGSLRAPRRAEQRGGARILLRLVGEGGDAAVRRRVGARPSSTPTTTPSRASLAVLAAGRLVTRQRRHGGGRPRGAAAGVAAAARLARGGRRGTPAPAPPSRPSRRESGALAGTTRASSIAARGWPARSSGRAEHGRSSTRPSANSWPRAAPRRAPARRAAHEQAPARPARGRRRPAGGGHERRRPVPRPARRGPR